MVRKFITGTLLVVMVAWAEMSLAPMLAMHILHARPGHEMAANMAAHHQDMPVGHPCCPKIGRGQSAVSLQLAASSLPCQDEHRCCFLRGPQNLPAPVNAGQGPGQEVALAEAAELSALLTESHIFLAPVSTPGPPLAAFGMVLRV